MFNMKKYMPLASMATGLFTVCATSVAFADGGIGGVASKVTTTLGNVGTLMVAISYLAGFGFLTFGIIKFKQHKDNPNQIPLGTPMIMTIIGAALLFTGAFIKPIGETFGLSPEGAGGFQGAGAANVPGGGAASAGG